MYVCVSVCVMDRRNSKNCKLTKLGVPGVLDNSARLSFPGIIVTGGVFQRQVPKSLSLVHLHIKQGALKWSTVYDLVTPNSAVGLCSTLHTNR